MGLSIKIRVFKKNQQMRYYSKLLGISILNWEISGITIWERRVSADPMIFKIYLFICDFVSVKWKKVGWFMYNWPPYLRV